MGTRPRSEEQQRHERQRHLGGEHAPPGERLGQGAAGGRPDRRPDGRGARPGCHPSCRRAEQPRQDPQRRAHDHARRSPPGRSGRRAAGRSSRPRCTTAEASAKTAGRPRRRRSRRPASARYAAGTAARARTRLKAVITHETRSIETSNVESTSGRASTTTDESASTVATASRRPTTSGPTAARRSPRRRRRQSPSAATSAPRASRPPGQPLTSPNRDRSAGTSSGRTMKVSSRMPDRHRERELAERAHVDDREQGEARRQGDARRADRRGRPRRGQPQRVSQRPHARLLPDAAGDEHVVVRSQRHQQHPRGEGDIVGQLVVAEQRLERPGRDPQGGARPRARPTRPAAPARSARAGTA